MNAPSYTEHTTKDLFYPGNGSIFCIAHGEQVTNQPDHQVLSGTSAAWLLWGLGHSTSLPRLDVARLHFVMGHP